MSLTLAEIDEAYLIKMALDKTSYKMLTFDEFIGITKISVDKLLIDKIFHNIQNKIPIYFDNNMIEYFGYSGVLRSQKQRIKELIQSNFIDYRNKLWWRYSNDEYKEFLLGSDETEEKSAFAQPNAKKQIYPPLDVSRPHNVTHLLVMPNMFREMLILCNTDKGKKVRHYYIVMMLIYEMYRDYQISFGERGMIIKDCEIINQNKQINELKQFMMEDRKKSEKNKKEMDEKFNILMGLTEAVNIGLIESNKKLTESNKKLDSAKIIINDTHNTIKRVIEDRVIRKRIPKSKHNWLIIMMDKNDDDIPYYAIRTQKCNIQNRIKKLKNSITGSDIIEILRIEHPNAMAFWEDIKQKYCIYIVLADGNWFSIKTINLASFKRKIKRLNLRRKSDRNE